MTVVADVDVAALLRPVWRGAWLIVLIAIIGAATGAALARRSPSFEAEALVTTDGRTEASGWAVPIRSVFQQRRLAQRVVSEYGLDKPPYRMNADLLTGAVRVDPITDTNTLRLHFRLPNGEMAARVLKRMADEAIRQLTTTSKLDDAPSAEALNASRQRLLDAIVRRRNLYETGVKQTSDEWTAALAMVARFEVLRGTIEEQQAALANAEQTLARLNDPDPDRAAASRAADRIRTLLQAAREEQSHLLRVYDPDSRLEQSADRARRETALEKEYKAAMLQYLKLSAQNERRAELLAAGQPAIRLIETPHAVELSPHVIFAAIVGGVVGMILTSAGVFIAALVRLRRPLSA